MTIVFHCGKCGKELKAPDGKAGQPGECPRCEQPVVVPQVPSGSSSGSPTTAATANPVETAPRICPMCGTPSPAGAESCQVCGESFRNPGPVRDVNERFSKGHRIRISPILSTAWDRFTGQMGIAIAGGMIYLFSAGVLVLLTRWFWYSSESIYRPTLGETAISAVCYLGFYAAQIWLVLGLCRFSLTIARGKRAEISQVFSGFKYLLPGVLSSLLVLLQLLALFVLAYLIALLLFVATMQPPHILLVWCVLMLLETLVVLLLYFWTPYILVDIDTRGVYAILHSYDLMKGNFLRVSLILIISILILLVGVLAVGAGLIVAFPLVAVLLAVTYDHLSGGADAVSHPDTGSV